jgi:hypothetical protein
MKIMLKNSQNSRASLHEADCPDMLCQNCTEYYGSHQYRKMISEMKGYGRN